MEKSAAPDAPDEYVVTGCSAPGTASELSRTDVVFLCPVPFHPNQNLASSPAARSASGWWDWPPKPPQTWLKFLPRPMAACSKCLS